MRRHGKTDNNQTEIVAGLRAVGASVTSLADLGHGVPDLLVGHHGETFLMEVKTPEGSLTPDQVEYNQTWRGRTIMVVRSVEDAIKRVTG